MRRSPHIVMLLACTVFASCSNQPNGTGTYAEDDKEIAEKGSFQGQETHGQVGTVEDQRNAVESIPPGSANSTQ